MTEGPEREQRQLEVLDRERDPDDGDGQGDREADVADEDPDAGEEEPEDVADRAEERNALVALDVLAKREQSQRGDLEALEPEGDADHGEAEQQPHHDVLEPDEETSAEDDPEDVQKQGHVPRIDTRAPFV